MKYSEYRSNIKSGDILAWSYTKFNWTWYDFKIMLVRLATRSKYTHVGIAWIVGGRVFILEAVSTGVRIFPLSKDVPFMHLTWKELTNEQLEFALEKVGEKYSYWECFLAFFKKNNPNNDDWECAEFVGKVMDFPCKAEPVAVVDYVLQNNGSQIIEVTP
jgi:hypothetical protein